MRCSALALLRAYAQPASSPILHDKLAARAIANRVCSTSSSRLIGSGSRIDSFAFPCQTLVRSWPCGMNTAGKSCGMVWPRPQLCSAPARLSCMPLLLRLRELGSLWRHIPLTCRLMFDGRTPLRAKLLFIGVLLSPNTHKRPPANTSKAATRGWSRVVDYGSCGVAGWRGRKPGAAGGRELANSGPGAE